MKRSTRLSVAIGISFVFFLAEIAVGFKTHSIALIADAFHYLNDLISFIVALVALLISEKGDGENSGIPLTYGWQRATLLGAFFNGVFLLALGLSIFLQSIERFISLQTINNPMLVVVIGAVGLTLNVVSILFLHEHDHDHGHGHGDAHGDDDEHEHGHNHRHSRERPGSVPLQIPSQPDLEPQIAMESFDINSDTMSADGGHKEHRHKVSKSDNHHDYGIAGVLIHIAGDAFNNIGVIIAGLVIWKSTSPNRYYADPSVSMAIAIVILMSAVPLVKRTGHILLQSPPTNIDVEDIKHDLERVPGVVSIHELHVWRLNQQKSLATTHIVVDNDSLMNFQVQAKTILECLHAYGVHSATIQPELSPTAKSKPGQPAADANCLMNCGTVCETMTCCG